MFEIAQYLEETALQFDPMVIVVTGLSAVLVGLFVWLGGVGLRKVLAGIVGAVSGGICGYFIAGGNPVLGLSSAVVSAVLAVLFERIFITVLGGFLAGGLAFVFFAAPNIQSGLELSQVCAQIPILGWIVTAAAAVLFVTAGFFLRHLASALCCAALGTLLVFAGMILLLAHKGSGPAGYIGTRELFFVAIFVVMITFGTLEQLLLFQRAKEKAKVSKQTKQEGQEQRVERRSWRTS